MTADTSGVIPSTSLTTASQFDMGTTIETTNAIPASTHVKRVSEVDIFTLKDVTEAKVKKKSAPSKPLVQHNPLCDADIDISSWC